MWTSVREALPKDAGMYMTTLAHRIDTRYRCVKVAAFSKAQNKWYINNARNMVVIAWQPLPEPYEE